MKRSWCALAETDVQPEGTEASEPNRSIGGLGAFSIVAGSMIGIGIFLTPHTMALRLDSTFTFLSVWLIAGLVSLCGAVSYAELGCIMPMSGGDYVFQRRVFGNSIAFAYGWGLLTAAFAGSIAAMAVPLCSFQLAELTGLPLGNEVFELPAPIGSVQWAELLSIGVVFLLTYINVANVRLSTVVQTFTTLVPLTLFTGMAFYAFSNHEQPALVASSESIQKSTELNISGVTSAFLDAYFAFAGWIAVVYVAGEIKNPGKNIPRSIIGGTVCVLLLYLLFAACFVNILGLEGLASLQIDAGSAVALAIGGETAKVIVVALITAALLSTINATILGGGRVGYALAKDGAFWSKAAVLHPRNGTPSRALWAQALFATVMILCIPWSVMFELVSLVMVVGAAVTVVALLVMRRREPEIERPYKALGYPYLPLIFVLTSVLVLSSKIHDVYTGEENSWYPMLGLGIVFAAYIFHRFFVSKAKQIPEN